MALQLGAPLLSRSNSNEPENGEWVYMTRMYGVYKYRIKKITELFSLNSTCYLNFEDHDVNF